MIQQSKFDAPTVGAIFQERDGVRTLAVMNHPDVFVGVADAWCRGGGNIFDGSRSFAIDGIFKVATCATYAQAHATRLSHFNRLVFIQRAFSSQQSAISDLVNAFPQAADRISNCRKATVELPDKSFILQCDLMAAD